MDEYYKLAEDYFKKFEPRTAFPGLSTLHWYLWGIALCSFGYFAYQVFFADLLSDAKPYWLLFTSEILFLFICVWIGIYRFRHTVKSTSAPSDLRPIERLIIAKRLKLEQLFNRPSWQFVEVIEEIDKLRKLEASYRSFMERSLVELIGKLFSPKVLATLLTVLASLLTLFVNWATKSGSFSLTELINDHSKLELLVAIAKLGAITVFSFIATYVLIWQLFSLAPLIISSVVPVLRSDHVILNYLISDLIRCQTMPPQAPLVQEPSPQSSVQLAQRPNISPAKAKSMNRLLLALLAMQTVYMACQATKHRPPPK